MRSAPLCQPLPPDPHGRAPARAGDDRGVAAARSDQLLSTPLDNPPVHRRTSTRDRPPARASGSRPALSERLVEWRLVHRTGDCSSKAALLNEHDRMVLLSAAATEVGPVQPRAGILRIETLAVQRDATATGYAKPLRTPALPRR